MQSANCSDTDTCERQCNMKRLSFSNINIALQAKWLCQQSKSDAVKIGTSNIHSEQEVKYIDTLNTFIYDLCRGKKLQQAKFILQLSIPNDVTYNHLIRSCCVEGNSIHEAFELLDEMMGRGLCPSVSTYNLVMKGLCNTGSIDEAYALLANMLELGCVPNSETYYILVKSLCTAKSFVEACDLVSDMVDKKYNLDRCISEVLIKCLYQEGQRERAKQLFGKIVGVDSILSPSFVMQLVKCFVREGFVDEGIEFIEDMISFGWLPDEQVYREVLVGVGVMGRVDQAKNIINQMTLVLRCSPCIVTYNVLVNSVCKAGYVDEACDLMWFMRKQGCPPNAVTYGSVIDGFSEKGLVDSAKCILSEMLVNGCHPNVVIYTSLIKGYCKAGMLVESMSLVKKMEDQDCSPNLYTYNTLLSGLCRAGKIIEVDQLLDEILEKGFIPDIFTYDALVDGLQTGCHGHEIRHRFDRIEHKCLNQEFKNDRLLLEALALRRT